MTIDEVVKNFKYVKLGEIPPKGVNMTWWNAEKWFYSQIAYFSGLDEIVTEYKDLLLKGNLRGELGNLSLPESQRIFLYYYEKFWTERGHRPSDALLKTYWNQ